jgi:glycosyltransferase involved in cell wall biosynthesis
MEGAYKPGLAMKSGLQRHLWPVSRATPYNPSRMTTQPAPTLPAVNLPAGAIAARRALSLAQRSVAPADNCGKRVGVLVVAFNAVTTLAAVLHRIPDPVWENVEEVVVFDDASPDDTYKLALGYKEQRGLDKLTVLRNPQNLGYGGNQKLGYRYFIDKGFDAVVLLHGDGQYAPEVLSDLYAPLVRAEADAVFGSRMMPEYGGPRKGGMPLYKLVGNRILTLFENRSLGMHLTEFHSGYRAYSLAALRKIELSHMTDDFHFDTEIIIKLHHQGFRIKEVPIPTFYGDELCYVDGMKYARHVFRALVRYRSTCSGRRSYAEFAEYAPARAVSGG